MSQDALSLQVSLPQMLDLALGTPEVGAVNLNILHNFLHVLLHQINLRATKVEYRGDEANRIRTVINASKAGPSLQLHEYSITDSSSKTTQRQHTSETEIKADVYIHSGDAQASNESEEKTAASAPVTARGKNGVDQGMPGAKKTKGSKQKIGTGGSGELQSVIFVEPILDGAVPTALGFKRLEETIVNLQQRFEALDELANNPEMIERVKSSKTDPLSDMWHVININKRLDGCEKAIEKLTTMLHDLIKSDKIEVTGGSNESDGLIQRIVELENQLAYLSGDIANLQKEEKYVRKTDISHQSPSASTIGTREHETKSVGREPETERVDPVVKESERPKVVSDNQPADAKSLDDSIAKGQLSSTTGRRSVIGGVDLTELKDAVSSLKTEMNDLRMNLEEFKAKTLEDIGRSTLPPTSSAVSSSATGPKMDHGAVPAGGKETVADGTSLASKNTASKLSIKDSRQVIGNKDRVASPAAVHPESGDLGKLEARVSELEKEMGCVNEKLNNDTLSGVDGSEGISALVAKIQVIEADMEKLNEIASRLIDEKDNRETHTSALIEQIELLKTIKADKEDLEDALADKADAQAVNRKVSHDQFDAACDDLARGLEDAITKLSQQESVWQQALDEVQREIEGKLDKMEISPLKEFVNNRLKTLQEKLKALAEMRRENEAAGTKKLLSDVQCISCDANAVMKMEEGAHYRAPTLPSSKSIKPYLTYELDQVRKQERRLPNSRNMLQFEAAMQEMARKSKPVKEELSSKSPRDHLCNRYCGGSHTITTPQQRVMRMGHFLTQWGPEAIQLTEGVIRGNDGQLYRSRPMPGKPEVSGASGDAESPEDPPATPPSPMIGEPSVLSQRHSQAIRGRSSISQAPKRPSSRKLSERPKDTKIEEIPSTPPGAPPATIVDETEVVPEPQGPTDQVIREVSNGDNHQAEMATRKEEEEEVEEEEEESKEIED